MIPRLVHHCWLSDDPWDELTHRCFHSWQEHLATYEFRLWDRNNAPEDIRFVREMLAARAWAFAADYIRLHALYTFGGIYLDLDVEVLKPFDPLLSSRAFTSYEDPHPARLACHVLGAEAGHPFLRDCLMFYRDSWRLRMSFPPPMPRIVTLVARRRFGYRDYVAGGQLLRHDVTVHPAQYFTPVSYRERSLSDVQRRRKVSTDSYAIHHWRHGWSWLDEPLLVALRRIPWLFMDASDWRFVLRRLLWDRVTSALHQRG